MGRSKKIRFIIRKEVIKIEASTIIGIVIVVLVVIAFIIWLVWQIKKKGLKKFATEMIVKAEDMFKKGENQEKLNYVIDKVIGMLPKFLQFFITRESVQKFVQSVFDTVKKALDYVPKKEE